MFRSLLCTQITALTHLENFTWLFLCGTNWLFFGTIWLGTNGPDSEGQGRGDWRERDGKAPSLRRVSLSLFSLPFLPFSSVSFFENYLSKKIIYQKNYLSNSRPFLCQVRAFACALKSSLREFHELLHICGDLPVICSKEFQWVKMNNSVFHFVTYNEQNAGW